ncbi:hypothetical protein Ancab_013700 [Ancistrocladus abbreviatus]
MFPLILLWLQGSGISLRAERMRNKQLWMFLVLPLPAGVASSITAASTSFTITSIDGNAGDGGYGIGVFSRENMQDTRMINDAYKPDLSSFGENYELVLPQSWCFNLGFNRFPSSQEMLELPRNVDFPERPRMEISELERMEVERQISASFYAMNGVQDYMETIHDPAADTLWDLPPLCSLFC